MTRRTKVVSKSEFMINVSMKLWCVLNTPEIFEFFQNKVLYFSILNQGYEF